MGWVGDSDSGGCHRGGGGVALKRAAPHDDGGHIGLHGSYIINAI